MMMSWVLNFDSYVDLAMKIFHLLYSAWDVKVFVFIYHLKDGVGERGADKWIQELGSNWRLDHVR